MGFFPPSCVVPSGATSPSAPSPIFAWSQVSSFSKISPAEDVPPRALDGLVSLGAPRLRVKQDVDRVGHVPMEPRHRVPRALLLLAAVRDVRLGAEIGRDPLLGQPARQVERAVHRVGVRLKREHAHEIGVVPRELLLELLLRGPVLDLEHLGSRLFEPPEELLDADAPALAGFAHQHVHAPIRDGRRHPAGVQHPGRSPSTPRTTTGSPRRQCL